MLLCIPITTQIRTRMSTNVTLFQLKYNSYYDLLILLHSFYITMKIINHCNSRMTIQIIQRENN